MSYTKDQLQAIADHNAEIYGLDKGLFRAIVEQESNWNPNAKSPTGVKGIGQITEATGNDYKKFSQAPDLYTNGVNREDPYQQLDLMGAILSQHQKKFNADPLKMAYAYNGGASAAEDFYNGKMFKRQETANYGPDVMAKLGYKVSDDGKTVIGGFEPGEKYNRGRNPQVGSALAGNQQPTQPAQVAQQVQQPVQQLPDNSKQIADAEANAKLANARYLQAMADRDGLAKQYSDSTPTVNVSDFTQGLTGLFNPNRLFTMKGLG